jgi:hypothetical protein
VITRATVELARDEAPVSNHELAVGPGAAWANSTGSPYGLFQKLSPLLRTERVSQERETDEQVAGGHPGGSARKN